MCWQYLRWQSLGRWRGQWSWPGVSKQSYRGQEHGQDTAEKYGKWEANTWENLIVREKLRRTFGWGDKWQKMKWKFVVQWHGDENIPNRMGRRQEVLIRMITSVKTGSLRWGWVRIQRKPPSLCVHVWMCLCAPKWQWLSFWELLKLRARGYSCE